MENNGATLQDVAKLAGVSVSTVSRILKVNSGESIPFAKKTQERVRSAASRLGYRPSKLARGLVGSRTGIVGLIVPSLEDSFFPSITTALQRHLHESGYNVLLVNTEHNSQTELSSIEDFLSWKVDGLIIAPSQNTSDARVLWELWRMKVPFVLVDRFFYDTPFYSVTTDDYAGGMMVVEHLLSLGRWRVARAGIPLRVSTSRLRHSGYIDALARNGIRAASDYILECETSIEAGSRLLTERILKLDPCPDALFCFSDMIAIGVTNECVRQGIRVPDDLAVVGYADLDLSRFSRVPLTTVRQPRSRIGWLAAEMLIDQIAGKQVDRPQAVLPVELVVRNSTVGSTIDTAAHSERDCQPPQH